MGAVNPSTRVCFSGVARSQIGFLFILVRKPFDVGDRIAVSDPVVDTNPDGSTGWIVEKVDLSTTTYRNALTREVATVGNGVLALTRVINQARSKEAQVVIRLKFDVDVPYSKIKLFRKLFVHRIGGARFGEYFL